MTSINLKMMIKDNPILKGLLGNDKDFCERIYSGDLDRYVNRLKAIGFSGKQKVLDAGCGFGQWSFSLSELNAHVSAFDYSSIRIAACEEINKRHFKKEHISFREGNLEKIDFPENYFDLVFCYSSIYFTNPELSLKEIFRVLKKGGRVYINTNDFGWYLHNLENNHNGSNFFSAKKMAIESIQNSFNFYANNKRERGKQIIMPVDYTLRIMRKLGFSGLITDGDGLLNFNKKITEPLSFFKKEYKGQSGVYEVIGQK